MALALNDTIYIKKTYGGKEDATNEVNVICCKNEVTSLCLNKEGDALVVGKIDSIVGLYSTDKALQLRKFDCHTKKVNDVAWCQSNGYNHLVATASDDGNIILHDVQK